MKTFWMVHVDGGQSPSARHDNLGNAEKEAARLAVKQGQTAYVLQSIASCEPDLNVKWERGTAGTPY